MWINEDQPEPPTLDGFDIAIGIVLAFLLAVAGIAYLALP